MPPLNESLEALTAYPDARMLSLVYPMPRTSWCQDPIEVSEVQQGDPFQVITYKVPGRSRTDGRARLAKTDIIWHDCSNVLALVLETPTRRTARILPLIAPESEEEIEGFDRSGGVGVWACVAQGWFHEWDIPNELIQGLPELVDASNPQALDVLPGQRKSNRRAWSYEGRQPDPWQQSMNARQMAFFQRQSDALRRLFNATGDEGESDILPKADEIEPGEYKDSVVPLDPNENPA
jgi:hypothetical protein